jgi:hypothetical protein
MFVESPDLALPLDLVSIVASFAALDPILRCFAVNTCVPREQPAILIDFYWSAKTKTWLSSPTGGD